jgi:DNA-binding CsgD family transcriptional regulator
MMNQHNNELDLDVLSQMMPEVFLWKKDINSVYTAINKDCAELFGIKKGRHFSGFTDHDIPCKISEFSEQFQQQDKQVIASGQPLKIIEIHLCSKNQWQVMLNTKNPLRDENNDIVGTFACCINITKQLGQLQHLFSSMQMIQSAKKSTLNRGSYILHQENIEPFLTKRQMDCLFYLMRGKTAKETASLLNLSKRTVEYYIAQMKNTFLCHTKSELIDLAISQGFMNIIPDCLYRRSGSQSITEK